MTEWQRVFRLLLAVALLSPVGAVFAQIPNSSAKPASGQTGSEMRFVRILSEDGRNLFVTLLRDGTIPPLQRFARKSRAAAIVRNYEPDSLFGVVWIEPDGRVTVVPKAQAQNVLRNVERARESLSKQPPASSNELRPPPPTGFVIDPSGNSAPGVMAVKPGGSVAPVPAATPTPRSKQR